MKRIIRLQNSTIRVKLFAPCSSVAQSAERVAVIKLQLPREIVDEKSGEFREACPSPRAKNGNPEPSPAGEN
jgi:hypothetical protein